MLDYNTAVAAVAAQQNGKSITAADITALLGNASVTFAQLLYVTRQKLAAAHKEVVINKVTAANVQLAANLQVQTALYQRAVRKSAAKFAQNDPAVADAFTAQENYYEHTSTYCVVQHRQDPAREYLYSIYNRSRSIYLCDGVPLSLEEVAEFCTPSEARRLLDTSGVVHNKTNNLLHSVHVRAVMLSNIVQIRARKQLLSI